MRDLGLESLDCGYSTSIYGSYMKRNNRRKRRTPRGKLIKGARILDGKDISHKAKWYTPDEAKKEKNARKEAVNRQQLMEDNKVQSHILQNIAKRYKREAKAISEEQNYMICQAMYHIIGDNLKVSKAHCDQLFQWLTVQKNPDTGLIDMNQLYRVFCFLGDFYEEAIPDAKEPVLLIWNTTFNKDCLEERLIEEEAENGEKVFKNNWKLLFTPED